MGGLRSFRTSSKGQLSLRGHWLGDCCVGGFEQFFRGKLNRPLGYRRLTMRAKNDLTFRASDPRPMEIVSWECSNAHMASVVWVIPVRGSVLADMNTFEDLLLGLPNEIAV